MINTMHDQHNALHASSHLRSDIACAAGAGSAWFGGLGPLSIGVDEPLQVLVVGAIETYLVAPGGGHDWGVEARVGAREQAVLALHDLPYSVLLVLWEIGRVGDPDCSVLQGVNGVLVAYGLFVEGGVLPHGIVLAADRRGLLVVHGALSVLAGRSHVELLDPLWRLTLRPLLAVNHDEGNETRDKGQDDQTNDDRSPVQPAAAPALAQIGTSLCHSLQVRRANEVGVSKIRGLRLARIPES